MKNNKYYIIALVQLFFSFNLIAQELEKPITDTEQKKWTLEECISYALENNITVKLSELDLDLADISKKDAYGNYLPSLNFNTNNQWVRGLTQNVTSGILEQQITRNFSFNGTSGVPIFQGLANLREFQRAKIEKLAAQYNVNQIKDNISLNVANSYLQILVSKQTLELLKDQNEVTEEQIDLTQELVDSGVVPEGDLLEIKAQSADEQQQITVAENDVQVALIALAQLLLIKDYEEFDIADEDYDIPITDIIERDPKEILQRAKEERYEVLVAEQDVELAKKDLQLSKSQYYPSISGFFNYNTRESDRERITQTNSLDPDNPFVESGLIVANSGESVLSPNFLLETVSADPFFDQLRNNDGYTIGIQMNIPVFNGFSVRNQVQRSKVNIMRAEYQLEQTKLELESSVYQAYLDARGAARTYEAALKSVEAQQLAYNYAESRFDVGMSNSVDLTQSKFRLVNAENNLIQAKYNYIFRIKVLELFFGIRPVEY